MYTVGHALAMALSLSAMAILFAGCGLYRVLLIERRLNAMEEAFNARLGRHEERLKTEGMGKIGGGTTIWEDLRNLINSDEKN